jgi:radical SAM protein with 4Fe4S-binding SPASM domain
MTGPAPWSQLLDGWRRRIESLAREHPLEIVSWEATRRCNLRCVHCGSPSEDGNPADELTGDEVVDAFEQIQRDFDMHRFRHINITGGEPFVRQDLLDILRRVSRWPCFRNIDIQTNGTVLANRPDLLGELKHLGVTGIGISIDGLQATHDTFRQCPGSFEKAFHAAKAAVQAGYTVTVSTVVHDGNLAEVPDLLRRVREELRPRVYRLMPLDSLGRAKDHPECRLSPATVRGMINFLKYEYEHGCETYADPRATMVEMGCGGWMGAELEGTFRPFIFHCIAGINNLGILYDGKLASCSNISRDFVEGDLRTERIREVWETRFQRYRDLQWKKVGPCANCDEWTHCHGGPMHKRSPGGSMTDCLHRTIARMAPRPLAYGEHDGNP